jgi:hypothetical protein
MKILHAAAVAALLSLAACSSTGDSNVSMMDSGPATMGASEISSALGGKTFAYDGAGTKGTIIYAADGTSLYTEDGKGNGTGRWAAKDGQLCQSFDPTTFLPNGRSETCTNFARSGMGYAAGPVTLTDVSG